MNKLFSISGVIIITLVFTGISNASLVGDTVFVERHFRFLDTVQESQEIVVENGDGDVVSFGEFSVDVDASSLTVDFIEADTFTSFAFNGLVIKDLNDDGGDNYILVNVDVVTDVSGWDESRIIFGDDFAAFNWSGLTFDASTEFAAALEFGPNPIPIPASMILFVTGLFGFAAVRKLLVKHR